MSVCVCGAQEKKKRSNLLTEGHSNVSEKVGFDWRFGIRGTVLIGL